MNGTKKKEITVGSNTWLEKGEEKMMNVNSGDNSGMLIVILVIVLAAAAMGIATLLRIRKNI